MTFLIKKGSLAPIPFYMVLASDHTTIATGKSPSVVLSKAGGAFAAAAGTVAEIADGYYALTPTAADTGTLGTLNLYVAAAASADPVHLDIQIVAFDPADGVHLGLTSLPNLAFGSTGGIDGELPGNVIPSTEATVTDGYL
jgi:hypothetical protein